MPVAQLPLIHPLFFCFFFNRFHEKGGTYESGKATQIETAANDNVSQ